MKAVAARGKGGGLPERGTGDRKTRGKVQPLFPPVVKGPSLRGDEILRRLFVFIEVEGFLMTIAEKRIKSEEQFHEDGLFGSLKENLARNQT